MHIRPAVLKDASKACDTLRRSIAELCVADHGNDKAILGRWLANKTPDVFASWLEYTGNTVLVADHNGLIAAVGVVNNDGEITCNYVSPDFRFQGVSKLLLAGLEAVSLKQGNSGTTLFSTKKPPTVSIARPDIEMVEHRSSSSERKAIRCSSGSRRAARRQ